MFFFLGLIIGSFLNVMIYRLPRGETLLRPRSHCPACEHPLSIIDLIPLLGYLFRRGRCAYCSEPISLRYPLVELLTASAGILRLDKKVKAFLNMSALRSFVNPVFPVWMRLIMEIVVLLFVITSEMNSSISTTSETSRLFSFLTALTLPPTKTRSGFSTLNGSNCFLLAR